MKKTYYVYILSSLSKVFYIGVSSNLIKRVYEHKEKLVKGFTSRYNVNRLVYFEETTDVYSALEREKKLKKWNRSWKERLIRESNPSFRDLYFDLIK